MGKRFALVTGAAKGIGKAIVKRLINDNYFVIAIDIDDISGKKLIAEFGKSKLSFAKVDICKEKIMGMYTDFAITLLSASRSCKCGKSFVVTGVSARNRARLHLNQRLLSLIA